MLKPVTLLPPGKELIRTIHILVYYFSLAGRRKRTNANLSWQDWQQLTCVKSQEPTTTSYSSQAVKYRWFLLLAIYCTGFVEAQTSQTSWLFLLSMTVRRPLTWTIRVSPSCEPLIIAKGPPGPYIVSMFQDLPSFWSGSSLKRKKQTSSCEFSWEIPERTQRTRGGERVPSTPLFVLP